MHACMDASSLLLDRRPSSLPPCPVSTDVVPYTNLGRFLAGLSMLVGMLILALPISIVGQTYMEEIKRMRVSSDNARVQGPDPTFCRTPHCRGLLQEEQRLRDLSEAIDRILRVRRGKRPRASVRNLARNMNTKVAELSLRAGEMLRRKSVNLNGSVTGTSTLTGTGTGTSLGRGGPTMEESLLRAANRAVELSIRRASRPPSPSGSMGERSLSRVVAPPPISKGEEAAMAAADALAQVDQIARRMLALHREMSTLASDLRSADVPPSTR